MRGAPKRRPGTCGHRPPAGRPRPRSVAPQKPRGRGRSRGGAEAGAWPRLRRAARCSPGSGCPGARSRPAALETVVCCRGPPGAERGARRARGARGGGGDVGGARGPSVERDGHEAGGTGAPRGATGGRPRRTEKTPNARLEAELAAARERIVGLEQQAEERERRLAEALEQQTATAEVLRVISRRPPTCSRCWTPSPRRGARCAAPTAPLIFRVEGDACRAVAGLAQRRRRPTPARSRSVRPLAAQPATSVGRPRDRWTARSCTSPTSSPCRARGELPAPARAEQLRASDHAGGAAALRDGVPIGGDRR